MSAIEAVGSAVAGAVVGAGTVLSNAQLDEVVAAGAAFAVSPGSSAALLSAGRSIPFVPGVATATELIRVTEAGFGEVKFFHAAGSGGVPVLSALGAIAPTMRFLRRRDHADRHLHIWRSTASSRSGELGRPAALIRDAAGMRSRARTDGVELARSVRQTRVLVVGELLIELLGTDGAVRQGSAATR
jgi:2-keto-3-deoxy-6-phosphogluconate aldolase